MKKRFLSFGMIALIFAASLTSCKNTEADVKDAQEDVLDAEVELVEAQNDAAQVYENYKREVNEKITRNNQKIADLRVKEIKGTADEKARYNERMAELEAKNNELKAKLDAYADGSDWNAFKKEVDQHLNQLETEFESIENNK